ncbi:MAG: DUF4097 family beta strand repeat protein [Planctomycetes bacterium]|nr:DUF4097 family beta strand repeat protein [Planctomycetota bacterium]
MFRLCVAVLFVAGAIKALVLFGGRAAEVFADAGASAEDRVEQTISLEGAARVTLANPRGPTRVRVGEGADVRVVAVRVQRADTTEEAARLLAEHPLTVEREKDGVTIRQEAVQTRIHQGPLALEASGPTVALEVTVPAGTELRANNGTGELTVKGPVGAVELDSDFGAVSASGVRGDASLTSKSGAVSLEDADGGCLTLKTGFGGVRVQRAKGVLKGETVSGAVHVREWSGERADLSSGFGRITLVGMAGTVTASTSSGSVSGEDLSGGCYTLETRFGGVTAKRVKGDLKAHSASGAVSVEGQEGGSAELRTSFGSVLYDGAAETLNARTASGDVEATVHGVVTPAAPWELASRFGRVTLTVPRAFSAEVRASTRFGKVRSDAPGVKVGRDGSEATGRLGDGGPQVSLHSDSGAVTLVTGE